MGWIVSTCCKAALLGMTSIPFPAFINMSRHARKLLLYYSFLSSYLTARLLVSSDNIILIIARRIVTRTKQVDRILFGALLGTFLLDEAAHMAAITCVSNNKILAGRHLHKIQQEMTCSICQLTQQDDANAPLMSFCSTSTNHVAHFECMWSWFTFNSRNSSTCPECRAPLLTSSRGILYRISQHVSQSAFWRLFFRRFLISASSFVLTAKILRALRTFRPRMPSRTTLIIVGLLLMMRLPAIVWTLVCMFIP